MGTITLAQDRECANAFRLHYCEHQPTWVAAATAVEARAEGDWEGVGWAMGAVGRVEGG